MPENLRKAVKRFTAERRKHCDESNHSNLIMSGNKRGGGKAAHMEKKLEREETMQAHSYLEHRKTELDKEIKAMEDKLASGNAAAAAELRAAGAAKSSTALNSRSFFSKLKAKMMDQNLNTKGA